MLLRRITPSLVLVAASLIVVGGYIHLRDWLNIYRDVPSSVPGSAVVRVGFPVNAGLSVVLAAALVASFFLYRRWMPSIVATCIAFQAGSLAALIISRTGSLFGWTESGWTTGANQTRLVEITTLAVLGAIALAVAGARRPQPVPA